MTKEERQVYWVWADMIGRCTNKNHSSYKNYGGRGITVSKEWRDQKTFAKDMGPRPKGTSLERMNNDAGYSKENCCWATLEQQSLNKRIYKTNRTGVRGIEPRGEGFRVRLRRHGRIVFDKTIYDFFEACCLAISGRATFAPKQ